MYPTDVHYFISLPWKRHENYAKKETINMIYRQALPQEINFIFSEGYKEWSKNRTFEQYCSDNAKEDVYKRFNFKILPSKFQRYEKSVCMVYCDDLSWNELLNCSINSIPNYF